LFDCGIRTSFLQPSGRAQSFPQQILHLPVEASEFVIRPLAQQVEHLLVDA
jgi:hypothetical protein